MGIFIAAKQQLKEIEEIWFFSCHILIKMLLIF